MKVEIGQYCTISDDTKLEFGTGAMQIFMAARSKMELELEPLLKFNPELSLAKESGYSLTHLFVQMLL